MTPEQRKKLIEDTDADMFSGESSWTQFSSTIWEYKPLWEKVTNDVETSIYFALMAKKFLSTPIRKINQNIRQELFVREIVWIFNANIDESKISEKNSNDVSEISYDFADDISVSDMADVNFEVKTMIKNNTTFAHLREYYVLNNGAEKDWYNMTEVEDWQSRVSSSYNVSPWINIFDKLPDVDHIDPDKTIIPLDFIQDRINNEIAKSIYVWTSSVDEYISELFERYPPWSKHAISWLQQELQKELITESRDERKVLLLAGIVAYYTNDDYIFSRMSMYKYASMRSIVDDIVNDAVSDNDDYMDHNSRLKNWFNKINKVNYEKCLHAISISALIEYTSNHPSSLANTNVKYSFLKTYKELFEGASKLLKEEKKMDHEVIETLMDHEYDAMYNSLLYFTGGDISEKDIEETDTYTRRMFRAGTTPESEKSQIILEEAIYQDSSFSYLKDPFSLNKSRLLFCDDQQLIDVITSIDEKDGAFNKFLALMLYACNADNVADMYDRFSQFDYAFHGCGEMVGYINHSLSVRYVDFHFEDGMMDMIHEYLMMLMKSRIKNIKTIVKTTELLDVPLASEQKFLLEYLQLLESWEDTWDIKMSFMQFWNMFLYHYEEAMENSLPDDDDEEEWIDDF